MISDIDSICDDESLDDGEKVDAIQDVIGGEEEED